MAESPAPSTLADLKNELGLDLRVPWFDVTNRRFGAKADGVTDDTAAIQLALNAAALDIRGSGYAVPKAGSAVLMPAGQYKVSAKLTVPESVYLLGDGPRNTVLVPTANFTGTAVVANAVQNGTQEWGFISGLGIYGNFVTGPASAPVRGIEIVDLYANSFMRDIVVQQMSGECIYVGGNTNCIDWRNIWANFSNVDCIRIDTTPLMTGWNNITAQYPGQGGGGPYACIHVEGVAAANTLQGNLSFRDLYFEIDKNTTYGLWLRNVNNVSGDNIRLQGGSNYTGQVCVQIDSSQSSPLTQDVQHSANIDLRNLACSQVASGRTLLVDTVRNRNSGTLTSLTKYTTEDITYAPANDLVARELLKGTIVPYRETYDYRYGTPFAMAMTSGTLYLMACLLEAGDQYGHLLASWSTTSATFGSNNDGHWWLAAYDDSLNLLNQTADQGITAITASTISRIVLPTTTVTQRKLGYLGVMVNVGTGGSPVMPTLKSQQPLQQAALVTGAKILCGTGQTALVGVAPSTATLAAGANLGYLAAYV